MHRKLTVVLVLMSLSLAGGLNVGCLSFDTDVKIIKEKEPDPGTVYKPEVIEDIPEQGNEPSKPGGPGELIPGEENPDDPLINQGGGNGGEVTIPEVLSLELISPASGDVRGGYEVRVRGKLLDKSGVVQFGAVQAPSQIFVNSNVVRAVVPSGKEGCVDVIWTQDDQKVVLKDGFCYSEKLDITQISPSVVVENAPVEIEISGTGFDENTRIYLSDSQNILPLVEPHLISNQKMRGMMPVLDAGKVTVMVVNASGKDVSPDAMEVLPQFAVESISPSAIIAGSSVSSSITGSGFGRDTKLMIGSVNAEIAEVSSNEIQWTAPALSAGSYDLLIWDNYRQLRLDNAVHYYNDNGQMQIFSVYPNKGGQKGGNAVSIQGVNLPASGNVSFGETAASVLTRTNMEWVAAAPAHQPGMVSVSVAGNTLENAYEYVAESANFNVDSLEPSHAIVGDSTQVTITGSGFDDDLQVSFGPWTAQTLTVTDSSHATVLVPPGAGTVPVLVSHHLQSKTFSFTYDEEVSIVGVSPEQSVLTGKTRIEVYGTGFSDGMSVVIDGETYDVTVVNPGYLYFEAPAHDVGTDNVILKCVDGTECAQTELTWFDPSGVNTSASGGIIDGELHVTVLTVDTAAPIPDATVYIGSDLKTALSGKTDENGRVSFFDDSLKDAQSVFACAPEHSCNTLQPVNASNITLFLEDWHADDPQKNDDDPVELPPMDGEMVNPIEVTLPFKPTDPYFSGTVGSFGKFEVVSNPNLVKAGLVMQSALSPYMMSYSKDDVYLILEEGGSYRIRARKGDVALALVCGYYDTTTGGFYPRYIGVKRHQFVNDGSQIVNHLECPLPLNQTQSVKLLDAPLNSGPNIVHASAYIFVGDEGYLGGFMSGTSETDYVVITQMPPLRDTLSESSFAITAGAYTDMNYPASIFYAYDVKPDGKTLEVGPAAPIPVFRTTNTEDILKTGVIQWSVEYPQNVDFYAMTIQSYSSAGSHLLYQFYLPGKATSAEFPSVFSWAEDHSEQLYITLTAYKSVREGFDFNLFSTGDVRYNYIHSSASANLVIRDPSLEPHSGPVG